MYQTRPGCCAVGRAPAAGRRAGAGTQPPPQAHQQNLKKRLTATTLRAQLSAAEGNYRATADAVADALRAISVPRAPTLCYPALVAYRLPEPVFVEPQDDLPLGTGCSSAGRHARPARTRPRQSGSGWPATDHPPITHHPATQQSFRPRQDRGSLPLGRRCPTPRASRTAYPRRARRPGH